MTRRGEDTGALEILGYSSYLTPEATHIAYVSKPPSSPRLSHNRKVG